MDSLNPAAAAAASSSGDWRLQLNPNARPAMRSTMLQTLRRYLPVEEVRRRYIATQIEKQCYSASANQSDYFKNIAAVIIHVEKQYQYRHPDQAPSLPQQGNNPAHSSASTLVSQQQSQQPDSTLVQASSLSSDDQSSTGDSQTSGLHNTSGQSTIGQMHWMVIQSATQSGIQHNPLNTVQQPVNQQQQHPEPSMNQQFSVQQIERAQQSLPQPATGELSNLHPNQPNNLLNQHETQDCMQPQHQEYTAFHSKDNLSGNAQPSPSRSEFSGNEDLNFWLRCPLLSPYSQLPQPWLGNYGFSEEEDTFSISEYPQDQEMNNGDEEDDTFSISEYLQDQEMNIGDEKDGCFDSTGLAAMEVPNAVFMTDRPTNPKKRKCEGSSSSAPVLR
ncbi:mediator of RNA polymerase II transcription subunit 15a-like isoform X2 [Panicum virgatum]|uniref:mediator of RNA polymerase II transcription subunit 15a-like isoform X2 n=1 Tax=Panicum virgatum TaxID=38727 RepID=UPI0019D58701|nr:mediator of RNA polymerase II transcription subunit 15a-like isoform X2 [Panicum virgatum]